MKRNIIVAVFLIILLVSAYISILKRNNNDRGVNYIERCKNNLRGLDLTSEQEANACDCTHKFLFDKYGNDIYLEAFVVPNHKDSLAIIECMKQALQIDSIDSEDVLKAIEDK